MKWQRWRKRISWQRISVSLAACSVALVLFSATVYAAVIPSVFTAQVNDLPWTGTQSEQAAEGNAAGFFAGGSEGSDEAGEDLASQGGLGDAVSAMSAALLDSPTFGSLNSLVANAPEQAAGSTGNGAEDVQQPTVNAPSQGGTQPTTPQPEEPASGLDAATEAAIHAHLVQKYNALPSWYNQVCEGFNNVYATMYPTDASVTHISSAPVNASGLLREIDQQRISVGTLEDGSGVPMESKWYDACWDIQCLYNNLVNSCSVMKTVNGFTCKEGAYQLQRFLNSDGKVSELAEFERNYPAVSL